MTAQHTGMGAIHDKDALFLSIAVGSAKSDDDEFEIMTTMSMAPLIRSKKTGKYFMLGWEAIVQLADEAGISRE